MTQLLVAAVSLHTGCCGLKSCRELHASEICDVYRAGRHFTKLICTELGNLACNAAAKLHGAAAALSVSLSLLSGQLASSDLIYCSPPSAI
jgi:hypothetical protein